VVLQLCLFAVRIVCIHLFVDSYRLNDTSALWWRLLEARCLKERPSFEALHLDIRYLPMWLCVGNCYESICCVATCWWCQEIQAVGRGGGSFMCCYRATKCQVLANFLYFNKFFRLKLVESETPIFFQWCLPKSCIYPSFFINLEVTSHKHFQGTVLRCPSDIPIEKIM
jgi:hypothetical protein